MRTICMSLDEKLKQNIHLPFDDEREIRFVEAQLDLLNKENFYLLGQSIIYRLLVSL